MKKSTRSKKIFLLFGSFGLLVSLFLWVSYLLVTPPDPQDFPISPTLTDRNGEILHVALSKNSEWIIPVLLKDMGHLPRVAIAIEDQRFYSHFGVDFRALLRALWQNLSNWKTISGASTITTQVVRLARPRDRSLWSKYLEFLEAIKLERTLSKDEILELYLNSAPFGGNLRGVGAASRVYFKKNPRDLSIGESVLLIAILPGPSLYRPDRYPLRALLKRDSLLTILLERGMIQEESLKQAQSETLAAQKFPLPREIPHLSSFLLSTIPSENWNFKNPSHWAIKTTIDPDLQKTLEARLQLALQKFPQQITGAAAILDNSHGEVLAYVGNARPSGTHPYVDCALARRSPGSILKPFIYLKAFNDNLFVPASLIADTPLGFQGAAPRNFDSHYRGAVTASRALSQSLNVPAVRTLRQIGYTQALQTLNSAGFSLDPQKNYGDSLILGGVEVTLLEVLRAYGTLARGGEDIVPNFLIGKNSAPRPLFNPASVWLINNALIDDTRLPFGLRVGYPFKTGTSHGFRDSWLAMYSPKKTLVLWLGDPTGAGHPLLQGLLALGETGAELFKGFGPEGNYSQIPEGVEKYPACPISGEPLGPDCPEAVIAYRLKDGARTHPCRIHTHQGGQPLTIWPQELAGFSGITREPARAQVISPVPGGIYLVDRIENQTFLPLKSEGTVGQVFWYVDGLFLGDDISFVKLSPGHHVVSLLDSLNQTAKSSFLIKIPPQNSHPVPLLMFK
ncbi:MAG: penicillin-binding protein 1C [Deltaproteobacteria bacterium]|jgi:penicillin-binding protein 1C|nr:penicillin-binding protein 1C [Deltaproteobacteria bacterium]